MRSLSLALLLLIAAFEADAQQLPIKTYTTADGLSHNSINRIVKDSRGFLWFCTGEGLSRFDS
jgi:ligand-binding sensor domain-containing protein